MKEKQVLEAIDRLFDITNHAFPFALNEVMAESNLGASARANALRSLRKSGDVKVLEGKVTFAVNAYLYKANNY